MPLIPPQFMNNPSSSSAAASTSYNKPPWARGPFVNNQQGNDIVPWRRNLRSVSIGTPSSDRNAESASPTVAPNSSPFTTSAFLPQQPHPQPVFLNQQQYLQQPKTSKLQINLRSVKKPDASTPSPSASGKVFQIPIAIQRTTEPDNQGIPSPLVLLRPSNFRSQPQQEPVKAPQPPPPPPPVPTEMPRRVSSGGGGGAPPPAPPPLPGGPPPPPPPPMEGITTKQLKVEQLRKAPKKRPDWAGMMKEIEKGRLLKHVDCNDRSKPIIPKLKSRGRFVFESEAKPASKSDALHDRLLNEIQQGIKLKRVKCNDRSRPILSGLRVRRQSSMIDGEGIDLAALSMEPVDELAFLDIDVLRDELQSAKQMLSAEVESKHNLERKTRDQKCQIIAMEAEIESLKGKLGIIPEDEVSLLAKNLEKSDSKTFKLLRKSGSSLWKSPSAAGVKKSKSGLAKQSPSDANLHMDGEEELTEVNEMEEEIISLKEAVQHARKQAEDMEAKYKEALAKLQTVQDNLEDSEQKRKGQEKQMETLLAQQGNLPPPPPIIQTAERTTQTEEQIFEHTSGTYSRQQSGMGDGLETDEDDSDVEVDEESVIKKKQERDLKLWDNKVRSIKDKQHTSRLERRNLKNLQKKLETELKEANKRHKKLQKEVDKMAKMLKDAEKDEDEDEEDEEEEEEKEDEANEETDEEESEEEEEEESESDSDEDEGDNSSEEDDEDASYEDRLAVFGRRVKKRENVLNALRKGNYLLRANIDRLKDDLEEVRISYHDLEHELNSVLEEM